MEVLFNGDQKEAIRIRGRDTGWAAIQNPVLTLARASETMLQG